MRTTKSAWVLAAAIAVAGGCSSNANDDAASVADESALAATFSGWSEVPGGGTTQVSDAAVAYNGKLYIFGIGIGDHGHYVNSFDGASWSGWSAVPGGGTTLVSDAAVSFNGKLYLFGIGIGDHGHYVNVFDGAHWSGWSAVPGGGTTLVPDAAVSYGGKLYLFGIGIGDHGHYMNVFDGASWSGWSAVPGGGTTQASDAAVAHDGKLYLFGIGINDHAHYVKTFDGTTWSGWSAVPGGGTTVLPDTATSFGGKLFLFGIGINDHKHYVNVLDGATWSGWSAVPGNGTTSVADAAVAFNNKLYLFAIGTNDHKHYMNVGTLGNPAPNANPFFFPVGPAPQDGTAFGVAAGVSGRVWTIATSTNYDGRGTPAMYLGIAGGGVWRSTDFTGSSPGWSPLTDKLPGAPADKVGLSNVGAIAVDPFHPRVLYAGTGDPAEPGPNGYGAGLLKSTDGGDHWSLLATSDFARKPGFQRIFVDPTDATGNTVYANAAFAKNSPLRGVYKSSDAGATWTRLERGLPDNVAVTDLDFVVTGNNQLTLYAGVVDLNGGTAKASGVWESVDHGTSFVQVATTLTDTTGASQPQTKIGDVKLAADHAPGASHGVIAAIGGTDGRLVNVLKLQSNIFRAPPGESGLSNINLTSALSVGMAPDGSAYVGGVNDARQNGLYASSDQTHWFSIDVGSNGLRPHTDQHAWAFWNGAVYNGNDGGIWRYSPNGSSKGPWASLNTGTLQTILVNGIGVHPTNTGIFLVGSQDNTVALRTSGVWHSVSGAVSGDASRALFDPQNGNYAYTTGVSDYHFFSRSDDGGKTWKDKSPGGQPNVPWYAPFGFNPSNTARIVVGLDKVYETPDRGEHWNVVSGVLGSDTISAIASAGGNTIWAAYGGRIFVTTNDGASWSEKTGGVNFGGGIVDIEVDPRNASNVYVSVDGGHVWRTTNAGASWEDLTGDFPAGVGIGNHAFALYPFGASDTALFVGTNAGLYAALKVAGAQTHWQEYGQNVPEVGVTDVQISPSNGQLSVGLYGRGVFFGMLR